MEGFPVGAEGVVEGCPVGAEGVVEGCPVGVEGVVEGCPVGVEGVVEGFPVGEEGVVEGCPVGVEGVVEGFPVGEEGVPIPIEEGLEGWGFVSPVQVVVLTPSYREFVRIVLGSLPQVPLVLSSRLLSMASLLLCELGCLRYLLLQMRRKIGKQWDTSSHLQSLRILLGHLNYKKLDLSC